MAKKKARSTKSNSSKKKKSSKKSAKKSKKTKPVRKKPVKPKRKSVKKAVKKKSSKSSYSRPQKTISKAQKQAVSPQDILDKYKQETGYSFDKPSTLEEFDKHLEETAKMVSGEKKSEDLPHFSDDHIKQGEKKQESKPADDPFDKDPAESMVEQLKKPETPDPDHHTLSSEHSHPYTEQPKKDDFYNHNNELHPHHKHAINAIVLAFVGVIVPVVSIVGFFLALHSVRKGSHTGKGAVLLSVATFVINLVLIYIFYSFFLTA